MRNGSLLKLEIEFRLAGNGALLYRSRESWVLASYRRSLPPFLGVWLVFGGHGSSLWLKLCIREGIFNKARVASFRDHGVNSALKNLAFNQNLGEIAVVYQADIERAFWLGWRRDRPIAVD